MKGQLIMTGMRLRAAVFILIITVLPSITSQQASGITVAQTNLIPMPYLHRPDDYNFQTGMFTMGEYEEISHPRPFPFEIEYEHICLYYDSFVFSAVGGQHIEAYFQTVNPVNFYVLTRTELISFHSYFCGNGYWSSEFRVSASSYDVNWIAPQTGVYAFVFTTNRLDGGYVHIQFTAGYNATT